LIARAIEIEDGYGDRPGTAATLLTNLGSVYFSEHKDALATKAAEDSLERLNKLGDSGARAARNLGLLGAIDLWSGQSAQAESYLQRALDISRSVYDADDTHVGEALSNLATCYSLSGQTVKAEDLFAKAKKVFATSGGDNAFVQQFLFQYSSLERKAGHKKQAKQLERESERMSADSAQRAVSAQVIDAAAFRFAK
jgi:tetratricopeptide (TPR) repeat protein